MVDASLAAILRSIAEGLGRDRKPEREALARIAREFSLLRAALRRERRSTGLKNNPPGNGRAARAAALIA